MAGAVGREIAPARQSFASGIAGGPARCITPRSSMDRTQACGACDIGSIPIEGTKKLKVKNEKLKISVDAHSFLLRPATAGL